MLYAANFSGRLKNTPVHIIGTSFFNSDIYAGQIFKNDLYVTVPYTTEFFYDYPAIKGSDLKAVFCSLVGNNCSNYTGAVGSPAGFPKDYISINPNKLVANQLYSLVISDYDASGFEKAAKNVNVTVVRDSGYYTNYTP